MSVVEPSTVRLMGAQRRRLVEFDRNSPSDARTVHLLLACGWYIYAGPATADAAGWAVHDGTDPHLRAPVPYERPRRG